MHLFFQQVLPFKLPPLKYNKTNATENISANKLPGKNPLRSHIQHLVPANISAHQICLAHSPVEEDCAVLLIHW